MLREEERRRRRVPAPLAIALAVARGRREWSDPERRMAARRAIDTVVGDVAEREALARAHLVETAVREELIWRPWQFDRAPVRGREHLERALAEGRGVVASFVHSGPFPGIASSLATVAHTHMVIGEWLVAPWYDSAEGRRVARWRANLERPGITTLVAGRRTYERVESVLLAGGVVAIAFDVPGSEPTPFLGREVGLAAGTARIAAATGALVMPVWRARRRWRPTTEAARALDPVDHSGWRDLHHALAAVHGDWILRRPAALEDPARPGWWAAHGVYRPRVTR